MRVLVGRQGPANARVCAASREGECAYRSGEHGKDECRTFVAFLQDPRRRAV